MKLHDDNHCALKKVLVPGRQLLDETAGQTGKSKVQGCCSCFGTNMNQTSTIRWVSRLLMILHDDNHCALKKVLVPGRHLLDETAGQTGKSKVQNCRSCFRTNMNQTSTIRWDKSSIDEIARRFPLCIKEGLSTWQATFG